MPLESLESKDLRSKDLGSEEKVSQLKEKVCQLNGKAVDLPPDGKLVELIASQGYQGEGFAIAINGEFVPRSNYASTAVKAGDCIDVVAPVTGG